MALRKEMQEMQEWINQAEEDYLERDFTYKTPEDLRKAVEELKVCEAYGEAISGSVLRSGSQRGVEVQWCCTACHQLLAVFLSNLSPFFMGIVWFVSYIFLLQIQPEIFYGVQVLVPVPATLECCRPSSETKP